MVWQMIFVCAAFAIQQALQFHETFSQCSRIRMVFNERQCFAFFSFLVTVRSFMFDALKAIFDAQPTQPG